MPKKQKFKIHDPTGIDAFTIMGILAGGGLAGRAQEALQGMESGNTDGALRAVAALLMGAMANHATRDQLYGVLFDLWHTTEDDQALEEDKDLQDRLERKTDDEGELDKSTLYYRKLKRFYKLSPVEMGQLVEAVVRHPNARSFLGWLRESLSSLGTTTNGSTGSSATITCLTEK